MAVTDLTLARTRLAVRPLSIILSFAVLAWIGYITVRFVSDAYEFGASRDLIDGLRLSPELDYILRAGFIAAGIGVLFRVAAPEALFALKALAITAACVAGGVLTVTSGQAGEVAAAAGLVAWAWWAGGPLLAFLDRENAIVGGWARGALETALGLALLSFAVLAVSLVDILSDVSLVAVLVAGASLGLVLRLRLHARSRAPRASEAHEPNVEFVEYTALALLAIALTLSFGVSLAPQTAFDALHYHFAMPLSFLDHGGFVERPDIAQSYFPLGLEMTFIPAFRFGGETSMTLLHWAFAPLTAALLWGAGNRLFGRPAGALVAAAFVLAPLIGWEAPTASSDLAMTFWLIAAAVAMAAYAKRAAPGLALATGLFAGLALTFKIVSGIYLIPIAIVFAGLLLTASKASYRARLGDAGLFTLGGLAAGAPWLLIRLFQTGNPVFPLYNNIFKSDKWPPVQEKFDLWLYGIGHSAGDAAGVLWEVALHPWRFGQWQPAWAIGIPVLAVAGALALLPSASRNRQSAALLGLTLLAAAAWFFLSQYHRYGLPAFALTALVGAGGLTLALRDAPKQLAGALGVALICAWFAGGAVLLQPMFWPQPFPSGVVLGRESREDYRERTVPGYDALRFLDGRMRGTDEAAALVGYPYNYFVENRVYDINLPSEISPFTRAALYGTTPDAAARILREGGISWLLIDYRHPPGAESGAWPPAWLQQNLLNPAFLGAYTEVAYDKGNVIVYHLLDR